MIKCTGTLTVLDRFCISEKGGTDRALTSQTCRQDTQTSPRKTFEIHQILYLECRKLNFLKIIKQVFINRFSHVLVSLERGR